MISLDLYGDPVAQGRPRFFKSGEHMGAYDAQKKLKEGCKWQLRSQYRDTPMECPLYVDITFFMPIPKSTRGMRRRQMLNGVMHHMKKPDIDNLIKFTLDCLNDIVIKDDAQIAEIRVRKLYSEKPGTNIRIRSLSEQQTIEEEDEDLSRENGRGSLPGSDPRPA